MDTPPPDYYKRQPPTHFAEYRPPRYHPSGPGQMAPQLQYAHQPQSRMHQPSGPGQMAHQPQYAHQPQPMMHPKESHTTVIVQQPAANMQDDRILGPRDGHRDWSTGLFSCFDDMGKCLWTMFCPSCVLADISTRMGECALVTCCVPGGLVAVRSRVRTLGGIRGSICMDFLATECCQVCAMCQLERELDYMGL